MRPFSEFDHITTPMQVLTEAWNNYLRPTIPSNAAPKIVNVVKSCWDRVANNRPSTSGLLLMLEDCWRDYEDHPEEWNQRLPINSENNNNM